jgi:hypothetical protein
LIRATYSATSPAIRTELFHSSSSRVVDATCLRVPLRWSAIGPSSYGQWAAKISYVPRPSSSSYGADSAICCIIASSK